MTNLPDTLEEIFQKSIKLEEEGYEYYLHSAPKIKNSLGRRMLERLANDEKNHIDRFKEMYRALTQNKTDSVELKSNEPASFEQIFERLKEQLDGALEELGEQGVDDREIIEMAMDLENHSKFFYRQAAEKAQSGKIKTFYQMLADEEQAHYDLLQKALQFFEDPSLFFGSGGRH
ncbi:MAG: ferritin family protein [Calditrichaeota bacterium]|nr:ferritin family protein [Calditrichota bacterium]